MTFLALAYSSHLNNVWSRLSLDSPGGHFAETQQTRFIRCKCVLKQSNRVVLIDGQSNRAVWGFADPESEDAGETAMAAATTERVEVEAPLSDELEVSVRLLDEGALVRWRREPSDESRCTLRWYEGPPPGERLLAALHTHHDYALGECAVGLSMPLRLCTNDRLD